MKMSRLTNRIRLIACALTVANGLDNLRAGEPLVLRNGVAEVSIAVDGGGIVDFRFVDQQVNPLNWGTGPVGDGSISPRGHFLCLDRWGAPSAAEGANGIPFHGEASRVVWNVAKSPGAAGDRLMAKMDCHLPLAGMSVQRRLRLESKSPVLVVQERVSNLNKRGRIYNMVQHPTIAPPFLDESTVVDSNAGAGFWQAGTLPESQSSSSVWPHLEIAGKDTDLRRLHGTTAGTTRHDVTSFVFGDSTEHGWVTACNPNQQLLIGYLCRCSVYPWLNIWRSIRDGEIVARGLEFGTTGYHQPFAQLVKQGRILDRPLYDFLDAGQAVSRRYAAFLVKVPTAFRGVGQLKYHEGQLTLTERGEHEPRIVTVAASGLFEE